MHRDDDLVDPPDDAYVNEDEREIDNDWLAGADQAGQVAAMVQWFHARFWDPAHETPYISAEGGYIWIHGGPYDATEQIEGRFAGIASEEAIEAAIARVQDGGIYDWAPTQLTYYDRDQDAFVDERNGPTKRLEERLDQMLDVLSLQGDEDARKAARNLAYVGVMAALEAFLWETMAFWVDDNETTVSNLITKHPGFRDRLVKLGNIYELQKTLKIQIKAFMQSIVWHRADSVGPLFKYGLGVDLGFKGFDAALKTRHDIVHRFGHDVDGNATQVSDQDVRDLAANVLEFANKVDEKVAAALLAAADLPF